jgi:hypothetical protein
MMTGRKARGEEGKKVDADKHHLTGSCARKVKSRCLRNSTTLPRETSSYIPNKEALFTPSSRLWCRSERALATKLSPLVCSISIYFFTRIHKRIYKILSAPLIIVGRDKQVVVTLVDSIPSWYLEKFSGVE